MSVRHVFVVLFALLVGEPGNTADLKTERQAQIRRELRLIDKLEKIEADQGVFSTDAIPSLLNLSLIYVSEDRCADAIFMLTRAVKLSRAANGLFNVEQMELMDPLMECYLALELREDFEREQRYSLLIGDLTFGKDDPGVLPVLRRTAQWYEQAGWYVSARKLYMRSVDIARKGGSIEDSAMVDMLRSVARTYFLEALYGVVRGDSENIEWNRRGAVELRKPNSRYSRVGGESLQHAVRILRNQPEVNRTELVETLVELGDWYQMTFSRPDALRIYREAWLESKAPDYVGPPLFTRPTPVAYSAPKMGIAQHRVVTERESYRHYWVLFDFTVTHDGDIADLKPIEVNAPDSYRLRLAENVMRTPYRPQFVEGTPTETANVRRRQGIYVDK